MNDRSQGVTFLVLSRGGIRYPIRATSAITYRRIRLPVSGGPVQPGACEAEGGVCLRSVYMCPPYQNTTVLSSVCKGLLQINWHGLCQPNVTGCDL